MLTGLSETDRSAYRMLFDSLLKVLSEPACVDCLVRFRIYTDFVERLNDMIMGQT